MRRNLLLVLVMLALLVGCQSQQSDQIELVVFAAASLTETLEEISTIYEAEHQNISIVFNFDSSGTLKTQIEAGAVCDLFLSAGQSQMDDLQSNGSVLADSRLDLLENKVVLVTAPDNPQNITSFDDFAQRIAQGDILFAMGNSDVPVGQYSQQILSYYGLSQTDIIQSGCVTYGSNAKEVTLQVAEGSVDCGILYATDARVAGLTHVDEATQEMCGQVIYPGCVVATTDHPEESQSFLTYLTGEECGAIFEGAGFSPVT